MENIEKIRHSLSHLMSMAVQELYPKVGLGVGPTIDNGFYQDYDLPEKISPEIMPKLEKRMREMIAEDIKFKKYYIEPKDALKFYKHDPYKIWFIKDLIAKKQKLSFYKSSWFDNLCGGPHVKSTKEINPDAFKLTKIAGAYFRGDEKNKMLTRIYGVAFNTKKELDDYLKMQEEAEKRDHRKLGKELDLFCFSDIVGPGLPLYTPKGTFIKEELQKRVEKICRIYGFEKVSAPSLTKIDLFEISGHAKKFSDELFHVSSIKGHKFALKPVQCPHHTQIYASKIRSYKELPIRYMESDKQYRAEKSGEVGGLNRVYAITIEDGHSFCRVNQVKDEIKNIINIIKNFYDSLGLWKESSAYLSLQDKKHPEKYIGDKKDWKECEKILKEVSKEMNLNVKIEEGEAALYGPKIDFKFKDAIGKEIQIPTVQIDFATPKRFNLSYINEKGKEEHPVMVHRAILGSYERFLALLIEHFGGDFPVWLSPTQVKILTINDSCNKYAKEIDFLLREADIRSEINLENETISKKIREAELQKVPYIVIIGEKEIKDNVISVRDRKTKEKFIIKAQSLINKIKKELEIK